MEGESSISKPRRKLGEEQENTIQQLDGQFDTKDSEKEDVPMIIDDFPYECNGTSPFLDSNISENLDSSSSNLLNLLSLSWDDILYTSLMPLMSIEEIFRLRATSRGFRSMVDGYFMQLRNLDLTAIGSRFTTNAFKVNFTPMLEKPEVHLLSSIMEQLIISNIFHFPDHHRQ